MTKYSVQSGQSLMNVAVEVYGDVTGLFWLLEDNPGLGVTDRLQPGQVLLVRGDVVNARQQDYLASFGPFATIEEVDRPVGIGYWNLNEYIIY